MMIATEKFLSEIKLSEAELEDACFREVLDYIWFRARDLDPQGKGININVLGDPSFPYLDIEIFLKKFSAKDISFRDFLDQVTTGSDYTYSVTSLGVVFQPLDFKPTTTPLADALSPQVRKELQAIIIPEVTLRNCLVGEAAEFLSLRSRELAEDGIGFKITQAAHWNDEEPISINRFSANDATLDCLLDFFAKSLHLDYEVKGRTVILSKAEKAVGD